MAARALAAEKVERMIRDYQQPALDAGVDEALRAFVAERKASEPDAFG